MEDFFTVAIPVVTCVIGLPWLILHYVTRWKTAPKITQQDEALLDEMHQLSRRLEDRLNTVERLVASDNPDWRPGLNAPESRETYRSDEREIYRPEFTRIERSN